jgi:hypothetical protein
MARPIRTMGASELPRGLLQTRVADSVTVLRATWSVASSPAMPRHAEYMAWYQSCRPHSKKLNPTAAELGERQKRLARASNQSRSSLMSLPWGTASQSCHHSPSLRRTYAALVSFVDDYSGAYPNEFFPAREVAQLLDHLRVTAIAAGGSLSLDEQLSAALELTSGRLFGAAVLLHSVTRWIARDRDTRALGALPWKQRLSDAALLAPFSPEIEGDGDAPGDTYHYWANFVAGYQTYLEGGLVSRAMRAMFAAGPFAMRWIRGGLFGRKLFAGNHAAIDRLGLAHGEAAGSILIA